MVMTRHRTKRERHWWDQHRKRAGVARSYMVRVHAVENKLRNRVTTTGKANRGAECGGKASAGTRDHLVQISFARFTAK